MFGAGYFWLIWFKIAFFFFYTFYAFFSGSHLKSITRRKKWNKFLKVTTTITDFPLPAPNISSPPFKVKDLTGIRMGSTAWISELLKSHGYIICTILNCNYVNVVNYLWKMCIVGKDSRSAAIVCDDKAAVGSGNFMWHPSFLLFPPPQYIYRDMESLDLAKVFP